MWVDNSENLCSIQGCVSMLPGASSLDWKGFRGHVFPERKGTGLAGRESAPGDDDDKAISEDPPLYCLKQRSPPPSEACCRSRRNPVPGVPLSEGGSCHEPIGRHLGVVQIRLCNGWNRSVRCGRCFLTDNRISDFLASRRHFQCRRHQQERVDVFEFC